MDKQTVLDRLDIKTFYQKEIPSIKWNSSEWGQGYCFKHEDGHPSLFANKKTGQLHCKGCRYRASIFDFYMEKYNVEFQTASEELAKKAGIEPQKKEESKTITGKEIRELTLEGIYRYKRMHTYKKGNPQYKKAIFKNEAGDKQGRFFTLINEEKQLYTWGRQGKAVLYNEELLPERPNEPVMLCEGEHDSDTITDLGFLAVTPGGVNDWKPEMAKKLKGRDVCILPHNDTPGFEYALKIATSLHEKAKSIKVIDATIWGDHKGADISDWIAQGGTKDKLIEIIKQAPEWIQEEPKSLLDSLLKWNDLLSLDVQIEYLFQNLIPKGSIILLFGRGGIGKTSLALQISRAIAEGLPFGDLQTIKTPVYYIDFENPLAVLKQRVECIGKADDLYVWHISNDPMPPRLDSKDWGLYKQLPIGLLIFDTLRASHLSDENNSQDMAIVISRLKELREAGFTILLLHHTPKGNEGIYKGSTALLDLVDHVLSIEGVKDTEGESIEFDTDNLYRLGVRIKTRYEPYHIFLTFNPEKKGFEIAKDPDYEQIENIYEILKETSEPLKQKKLKERIKNELDLTDGQIRKLLKKGEGRYWNVSEGQGKDRSKYYSGVSFVDRMALYSTNTSTNEKNEHKTNLTNEGHINTSQTLENTTCVDDKEGALTHQQMNILEPVYINAEVE